MKQRSILATRLQVETAERLREARVRSIYLEWCGVYGKEVDETRFPIFQLNFIMMETKADKRGQSMQLNEWCDCTDEEYIARSSEVAATEGFEEDIENSPDCEDEGEPIKMEVGDEERIVEPTKNVKSEELRLDTMRLQEAELRAIAGKLSKIDFTDIFLRI